MKKILIADDHYVVRMALTLIMEAEFNFDLIIHADNYDELINQIQKQHFDIIILDINMPGSLHKAMIKSIKNIDDKIKILLFSAYDDQVAIQYIEEGANGFLNKFAEEKEIVYAIKSIIENGYFFPHKLALGLAHRNSKTNPETLLSEREWQVFNLLTEGNGNLEISNILNLKMSTVSTYKKRVFTKLNIKTIVDLIKLKEQLH